MMNAESFQRWLGTFGVGAILALAGCAAQQQNQAQIDSPGPAFATARATVIALTAHNGNTTGTINSTNHQPLASGVPLSVPVLPLPASGSSLSGPSLLEDRRIPDESSFHQSGRASYYAARFQGHRTSSGERYDNHELTAAHRTLPFGSYVRVTDLATSKSVIVKINDRGPFGTGHRIIDLSYAAASALGLQREGIANVRIEGLSSEEVQAARTAEMVASR